MEGDRNWKYFCETVGFALLETNERLLIPELDLELYFLEALLGVNSDKRHGIETATRRSWNDDERRVAHAKLLRRPPSCEPSEITTWKGLKVRRAT